jgi:Zn-dependent protease
MTQKNIAWLVISIIVSIIAWGFLVNWAFGLILLIAIMIHEYGHHYQMGKEGLRSIMIALPLLGALAIAKDPWTSRSAEVRIALAGPLFGIFSIILFYILWTLTQSDIFGAAIILACFINLFNLVLPIPFLDGGRVMRSFLFSINERLGIGFYYFGFVTIIFLTIFVNFLPFLLSIFLVFMLWQEYNQLDKPYYKNLRPLNLKEATHGSCYSFAILSVYICIWQYMATFPDTLLDSLLSQ